MKSTEAKTDRIAAALRRIPAIEFLLNREELKALAHRYGQRRVTAAARRATEALRQRIHQDPDTEISVSSLDRQIVMLAEAAAAFSLRPVINATGVVLHTNLGRAPLAESAAKRVAEIASQYSNLEYDLEEGERGKRDVHTARLFEELLGAESALVVNNNAAAVFLALNSLAEGGEVIVSRGELIEIGGSFRIPDICAKSGAVLREVGTTNKTRIADYAAAITERTRLLLRVHPSNFRMVGFTARPTLVELADLSARSHLPLMEDLGSGCLADLSAFGLSEDAEIGESLKAGVDVVTFSGDKLMGGPQAGILLGRQELLQKTRKNPLFRALRVDKLTIAAMEATVALYLAEDYEAIPAQRMIRASKDEVARRSEALEASIQALGGFSVSLLDGESVAGGGSTPGQTIPTQLIAIADARRSAGELAAALRKNDPPVIARVEDERLVLDLRTVLGEEQEQEIVKAFKRLVSS
jgi:L-seryl-tRNA(Ser) seleniumtransferase